MTFEKATIKDIDVLTNLRLAYLQDDLGNICDEDLGILQDTLPAYYSKQLMTMMLEDAAKLGVSVIDLKATEAGYPLYKSVGFEDVIAKYHNMKLILK